MVLGCFLSQAVSVVTRIGGLDMGYLARGALPFDARLVDGQFARLELGRCKSGVGVYARCALFPGGELGVFRQLIVFLFTPSIAVMVVQSAKKN